MAHWEEVKVAIAARLRVLRAGADYVVLAYDFGLPGQPQLQEVRLERIEVLDEPWLLLSARVCGAEELDPRAALAHNARTAVAHLALEDDHYIARQTARLATLAMVDVVMALELTAFEAIRVRRSTAARDCSVLWNSYGE